MIRKSVPTRREFLANTSTVVGATFAAAFGASFVPATALGRDGATAASERIRMGFIGCGRQCYYKNIPLFMRTGEVQAMAVCDVDDWRRNNAVNQIKTQYTSGKAKGTLSHVDQHLDYQDLLSRDDIDAVMISTPDHWHCQMALDAMKAGKDVALEKPITRTIAEGQRLIKAAAEQKRIFRVDSEFRSGESAHRATTLVRNGHIGRVRRVTTCVPESDIPCPQQPEMPIPIGLDYERWQGPAPRAPYTLKRVHTPESYERPGWMRHLYYCDGMITNWGTHLNNGAMWATDTERTGPVEIEATGTYPDPESFWNVLLKFNIQYKFADGLEWIYRTEKPYFLIEGDEGWVRADFTQFDAEPKSLLNIDLTQVDQTFPLQGEKENFLASVRSRQETLEPAEVGHRVTTLGHLGHIAIHTGRKLQWDPVKEVFVDDDGANQYLDKPIQHRPQIS
ncbi:Gfo/Idh/MocA family protein [Novipirellula artificiosorum]|uniref:Glucose--fructose oxidoreductase n=1 Tax=Novipirellula artificiosorum TaxID=2528016 RepID=A0A5C6DIK9_9BACT|nr:Gfo/Idh/MocA family oxidoreductase [Novipirellula artificiosorum]TWU35924.1 Glucose--fructose oxidoreductase precursor [Novipirellula artificiosorum]